jgi:hypothetical protein
LYIDAETDKRKTFKEFLDDVHVGATALSTSLSNGGLELSMEEGHVVGIVGRNSMVGGFISSFFRFTNVFTCGIGIRDSHSIPSVSCSSVCAIGL